MTKKQIKHNLQITRLSGFRPSFKYRYDGKRYDISYQTGRDCIEVYDKQFNGEYDEYHTTYHGFNGNKKDFVDFIQWFLNN